MCEDKPYWFEAKRYGFGWSFPVTWQGWAVVIAYFTALSAGLYLLTAPAHRWIFLGVLTVMLVIVVTWKGEKPAKWRWGGD